ncbi:Flagellar M-ring protein [Roseisalinus antarcticus]|uniref:Flagellar M-ring protein n=1 Tax=Roseisalinus antarcticus TaxID=254357 RepID=A0A1Y5U3S7_9RHOB|nr:Flagellar M-ring protein [Roseisalinus antarcticus]
MEGLGSVWSNLDARRKIIVVVATLAVFGAVLALGRSGSNREMSLLYAGLENSAAGEVIAALDARGMTYEVRGGAIYVDAAERDTLRLTLASEGLPANGSQGYELLDSLSGFGTTSQMFDAAYWRAKEGELARTIETGPGIRSARVHISTPSTRGFQRDNRPTAAVTVSTADGSLTPARAKALRYLVASAVSGLSHDDVAVIDGEGGLVPLADDDTGLAGSADREAEMRARVARLMEARVGPGNAIVELTLETETDSEQITERRFDPESRFAISTEIEERSNSSTDSRGGGAVTVASNLPDGDAAAGDGQSSSQTSETRELTNYEVSETQREIIRGPGAIKKISVAVLVNDAITVDDAGVATPSPRTEEELADLRDLVASAVGFDESRGDVITIRSMSFEPIPADGSAAEPIAARDTPLDLMRLIQLGVLAAVALVLGLFVVRPILASRSRAAVPAPQSALALESAGKGGSDAATPNLPALVEEQTENDDDFSLGDLPTFDMALYEDEDDAEDLSGLDPVSRLRRLMEQRQEETLQILQSWVDDKESEEIA